MVSLKWKLFPISTKPIFVSLALIVEGATEKVLQFKLLLKYFLQHFYKF